MGDRIFVTGASGFVGTAVLSELWSRAYPVNALVRRAGVTPLSSGTREIVGDLFNPAALDRGMADCRAVIHLVGIIDEKPSAGVTFARIHVEGTRAVLDAARRAGVRRYVHMSALGTRPDAVARYHRTKWDAEQMVRESGLDWTILRPSLIHGPGGFMKMEAAWARGSAPPFIGMPYFGAGLLGLGGSGLLQPVYVGDVARAFVDALDNPRTIGRTFELAGPERFTWPRMHRAASREIVGRPRLTLPLPVWYARLLARIGVDARLGFNADQVTMSREDNVADIEPFVQAFGWTPVAFRAALERYAAGL